MADVLVVDDERGIRRILDDLLTDQGHRVTLAASGEEAVEICRREPPELVLLDLHLPGMDGEQTARALLEKHPDLLIVVVTAYGSISSAVQLTKAGVYDYVTKPFDNEDLLATVDRALESQRMERRIGELEGELLQRYGFDEIVTCSDAMRGVFERMHRVAQVDVPVLILGESGTGKELVARAIHRRSRRSKGPLVTVNCGAIPENLVESEFFGHEAGAFTDARTARDGSFVAAHRGTLFLDEIGNLPLGSQAKLLRALQDGVVVRVGGVASIPVDTRLIAATNADLDALVAAGQFREDLYYRLNVVAIRIPPLRERRIDIPSLVDHFLRKTADETGIPCKRVTEAAALRLQAYDWPGNVRELENAIQSAMVLCPDEAIDVEHLPRRVDGREDEEDDASSLTSRVSSAAEQVEQRLILDALKATHGSRTQAAARLGISRKTLFNKMKRYGLQ